MDAETAKPKHNKKALAALRGPSPAQILVYGFAGMILVGAFLLSLPAASANGESIGFLNALFTSTSGVCVTGLTVFDPGSTLSVFGEVVLMILIQLGGIGFMTMTSLLYIMMGRRIGLKDRVMIRDSFNETRLQGMVRMTRNVLLITVCTEGLGILLLAVRFVPEYGAAQGMYFSVFHAISSFCNAGFDIFGKSSNLIPYVGDPLVIIVTSALIVVGGLGFFVVAELFRKATGQSKARLTLHTRMVLILTGSFILGGFLIFLVAEGNNHETLGAPGVTVQEKVLGALFQSVTPRTAGFSSIDQGAITPISKALTNALMFIGASPSGTGGGIKTTTAALLFLFILSIVRGKEEVEVAKRRIPRELVLRSVAIFTLALALVILFTALIGVIEHNVLSISDVAFEVTSAFGTVGLSANATPLLSSASRIIIIITMLTGRVGIFTMTMALARRLAKPGTGIRYPEEKIIIG